MPGCKTDEIELFVHGNTLTISGEKKEFAEKKEENFYHVERQCGGFRRDLVLPGEVDPDKVDASCKDGVLTITLPKIEKARAKKVKVQE